MTRILKHVQILTPLYKQLFFNDWHVQILTPKSMTRIFSFFPYHYSGLSQRVAPSIWRRILVPTRRKKKTSQMLRRIVYLLGDSHPLFGKIPFGSQSQSIDLDLRVKDRASALVGVFVFSPRSGPRQVLTPAMSPLFLPFALHRQSSDVQRKPTPQETQLPDFVAPDTLVRLLTIQVVSCLSVRLSDCMLCFVCI